MKGVFTIFIILLSIGCGEDGHRTEIVVENKLPGLEFTRCADTFDVWHGEYKIYAMLKNTGKKKFKYLEMDASYLDQSGKEVAQSVGGPGEILKPGDSAVVQTAWIFPDKDHLPYKVVLSADNGD
jgi:hypothetical protein